MLKFCGKAFSGLFSSFLYLGCVGALAGPSTASAASSAFMALGEAAPAPIGFLDFCARLPQDCRAVAAGRTDVHAEPAPAAALIRTSATRDGMGGMQLLSTAAVDRPGPTPAAEVAVLTASSAGGPPHLSTALMDRLSEINSQINHAIRPVSDVVTHGVPDHWDLPLEEGDPRGDCEDYALEKQFTLIKEGVPARDLSIAVVRTRWGEEHAVLLVSTDGGDLVMDNLSQRVRSWRDVDYQWIERQVPGQPLNWVAITGAASRPFAG